MATTAVVQKTQSFLPAPILNQIQAVMPNIPALLPVDISLEQFRAAAWLELRQVRGLTECSGESVAAALVKAAQDGLLPGRDCHIIPFKNARNGRKEATMVTKYQGLILSLERTGKIKKAFAHAVYSKDKFEVDYLADVFSHKPCLMGDRGKLQCVYGCILEKDGTRHFEVMSLGQIDAIKARAPGHDSGPWTSDYEEMARKTALKRVAKYVRLSPQVQQLLADDDERERSDIGDERFRETAADLYGEPREIPNMTQPSRVETRHHAPVEDDETPASAWDGVPGSMGEWEDPPFIPGPQKNGGQSFLDQIDAAWQAAGLGEEQIANYWAKTCKRFKVKAREHLKPSALPALLAEVRAWIAEHHTAAAPEPADWRSELNALLATFQGDDALLSEMYDVVNDETTADETGQAVLARARAYQAQTVAIETE